MALNEQLADLNKLLTQMGEHRARFAKLVDDKVLKEIRNIMTQGTSPAVPTATTILNHICAFVTGNISATYQSHGTDIFASPEQFTQAIKRSDPAVLEKQEIQKIAQAVNMDTDQKKGALLDAVTQPASSATMAPFFVFFKIVYKFAQMGMTGRTKANLQRKQEAIKKEMDDAQVQIDTFKAYMTNLSFYERIQGEANRIRSEDVSVLQNKKQILTVNINRLNEQTSSWDNFNRNYFDL